MAYDRARKEEIEAMSAGDLVHTMMVEFDPHHRLYDDEPGQAFMQSMAYNWALDRLNEMLPLAGSKVQHS